MKPVIEIKRELRDKIDKLNREADKLVKEFELDSSDGKADEVATKLHFIGRQVVEAESKLKKLDKISDTAFLIC